LGENPRLGRWRLYGRIFLNVQGREPQGIVPPDAYEETRAELEAALIPSWTPKRVRLWRNLSPSPNGFTRPPAIRADFIVYLVICITVIGSLGHGAFTAREMIRDPMTLITGRWHVHLVDPNNSTKGM